MQSVLAGLEQLMILAGPSLNLLCKFGSLYYTPGDWLAKYPVFYAVSAGRTAIDPENGAPSQTVVVGSGLVRIQLDGPLMPA